MPEYLRVPKDNELYTDFLARVRDQNIADKRFSNLVPLSKLYFMEKKESRTPFDAWLATCYASEAGIPPPFWVGRIFKDILEKYSQGEILNENREEIDLASIFGFRGRGKGSTAPFSKLLLSQRNEELCQEVWLLTLCGYKVTAACRMASKRRSEALDNLESAERYLTRNLRTKRAQSLRQQDPFANTLRIIFYKWIKQTEWVEALKSELVRRWQNEKQEPLRLNAVMTKYNVTDPQGKPVSIPEISWEDWILDYTKNLRSAAPSST